MFWNAELYIPSSFALWPEQTPNIAEWTNTYDVEAVALR